MQTSKPADEIVPGKLYRLGGSVKLDGRVSWAPALPGKYQPINCYLVLEKEKAFLIDTGPAGHRATIIGQLKQILDGSRPLVVFLTRAEFMCVGNLGAVHSAVGIDEIIAGGIRNPFDAYDEATRSVATPYKRQKLENYTSKVNPLGTSKSLHLISPWLRILTTYWVYDKDTKTLFTSDWFGHTTTSAPDQPAVVARLADDPTTYESALEIIMAKYSWLTVARTELLKDWLTKLFASFEIETIAPCQGVVLKGHDVVRKHYELMIALLSNVGEKDLVSAA